MIQPATILIADMKGYTDFISSTELEHSSHIVNELLELIVEADTLGLTVSEIEGDAVLFYKTGGAIPCDDLVKQCLTTFGNFHRRLKIIERDSICQCGACQGASDLGLKFVAHFGPLKEISVANFRKASGLDMIVAHRLLKNDIQAEEYVLVTDPYLEQLEQGLGCDLNWQDSVQSYADIGEVVIHYAMLDDVRAHIPEPTPRSTPVIPEGDDAMSLEIAAPLLTVYARLIDTEGKRDWVVGLQEIERQDITARIEEQHTCHFDGMAVDVTLLHGEIGLDRAIYSEVVAFRGMPFAQQQTFTLTAESGATKLRVDVAWRDDPSAPDDLKHQYMSNAAASLEAFKEYCEQ
jgi:hypothetical protein